MKELSKPAYLPKEAEDAVAAAASPAAAVVVVTFAVRSGDENDVVTSVRSPAVADVAPSAVSRSLCCRSRCCRSLDNVVVLAVLVLAVRLVAVDAVVAVARDAFRRRCRRCGYDYSDGAMVLMMLLTRLSKMLGACLDFLKTPFSSVGHEKLAFALITVLQCSMNSRWVIQSLTR